MTETYRRSLQVGVFGLLLGIVTLAGVGAGVVFARALQQGGGAIAGRWLLLLAVAGTAAAVIVASFIDMPAAPSRRALAAGIGVAGILTSVSVSIRALGDIDGIGPVEVAALPAACS